jgi:hypothetical protein
MPILTLLPLAFLVVPTPAPALSSGGEWSEATTVVGLYPGTTE